MSVGGASPTVLLRESYREGASVRKRTLAEDFDVADAREDDLYDAMGWLLKRQDAHQK